jgi:hypothetical protein
MRVTDSSRRQERSEDVQERGHWDGDKQCYVMGHIYVSSCVSSMGVSCPAASRSGSLEDLSGSWTECLSALLHGLLHELVVVF